MSGPIDLGRRPWRGRDVVFVLLAGFFASVVAYAAVYPDPTTLEAASLDLGIDVQTAGPFTRAGGLGIAANPDVVQAAFSDLVLLQDSASDIIDLGPSHAIMLRVLEHEPVRTQEFEEVSDAVVAGLQREWSLDQAREQATPAGA